MVLEASLGYAASCSVVIMDEVADLNERVDVEMRDVEEDVRVLKGEVVEMRDELRELREAHGWLSCQVGELNTLVEDMRRHLHLPRTPEERAVGRIESDLREAQRRRELDQCTGGKGSFTQWVHGEFIVGSETICPPNIHWVQGEYPRKELSTVPSGYFVKETLEFFHNSLCKVSSGYFVKETPGFFHN